MAAPAIFSLRFRVDPLRLLLLVPPLLPANVLPFWAEFGVLDDLKLQHSKSKVAFLRPLCKTRKSVGLTKACTNATCNVTFFQNHNEIVINFGNLTECSNVFKQQ